MKIILTLLILVAAKAVCGQTIEGIIVDKTKKEKIHFAVVRLVDSSEKAFIKSTNADSNGRFKFLDVAEGYYYICVMAAGYPSTSFEYFKFFSDTTLQFDIQNIRHLCKYDASLNNKRCPVCKKKNKVIPIRYGLLGSIKGDPLKNNGRTFKAGGCKISDCDPHWYCKRDKIEF